MKALFAKGILWLNGILFFLAVLAALAVIFHSGIRHNMLRMATEVPGIVTYFSVRKSVLGNDFAAASRSLKRHLGWSNRFNLEQSTLLPALMDNAEYVLERVRFSDEHKATIPFLRELVRSNPKLYRPHIWLARALVATDPTQAFSELKAAQHLVPADERAYRLAVEAALMLKDFARLRSWCEAYRQAQLGGVKAYDYNTYFLGKGMRKMALEAQGAEQTTYLVENKGIQLNQSRSYSFTFPKPVNSGKFRVHFATVPSAIVRLEKVVLDGAEGRQALSPDDYAISLRSGYSLGGNKFMLLGRDGDTMNFHLVTGHESQVDQIDFEMTFSRAPMTNQIFCR